MATNDQDEVIVDDVEENNEEVAENTEETTKVEKPKRTPQEEYEYHNGRAQRLAKKLGIGEKTEKAEVKDESSKPNDLDYSEKAFLKTYGISGSDELALVKTFKTRTGDDLDTIVSDDIFLGKLKNLREARESANAIPKGKNRSGQSNTTDIDLAVAKFRETGVLPADFETRVKVKNALVEADRGSGAIFK